MAIYAFYFEYSIDNAIMFEHLLLIFVIVDDIIFLTCV
jgi:hypothetical protein